MPRLKSVLAASLAALAIFSACKKSSKNSDSNDPSARTVANFSASYKLTALRITAPIDSNAYNGLDTCEKDNLTVLSSDLTAKVEDVGIVCNPPVDTTGTWSLSPKMDSIYINGVGQFIKSWDGSTLVLDGQQSFSNNGISISLSTEATFSKQKQ